MQRQIDFGHEKNLTADDLCNRLVEYYPEANLTLLRKGVDFATRMHQGQKRSSGEDYIVHPMNVAATLIKLRLDMDSIVAGLLHDVVEDCGVPPEEIEKEFGKSIAQLVVALTKISKIQFKTKEESQAENFRKMVVAMAKDLRVIIVKLADRMHNMRTLQYVSDERQKKIAQETLEIYVPLASRLGIHSVKGELEDLCLRYLKPDVYYRLAEKVAMKKSERENYIGEVVSLIVEKLNEYSVGADVKGRPKHFFSIYRKMTARGVDFEQIQDILAFRIIVNSITDCYKALGVIHSAFTPLPGRFKDYIAIPKINNYQSLHTTVIGPKSSRIEIQIRTYEMDEVAETGVAAHWKYKEGVNENAKLSWVEELLEFNRNVESNSEFMTVIKKDLDVGGIFVFTPRGDVHELHYGATPLDFAYAIHTEVGNHCIGSKVNGKMVPFRYKLKSGDTVEVLTNKAQTPSKDWLNIVTSSRAKTKIRQWLLKVERESNKEAGKEILEKAFRVFGTSIKSLKKSEEFDQVLKDLRIGNEDEFYVQVGLRKILPKDILAIVPSLKTKHSTEHIEEKINEIDSLSKRITVTARKKASKGDAVIVDGMSGVMVRLARCCTPIPGDSIVGYVTRGRGVTVHTSQCTRVDEGEQQRKINVTWNQDFEFKYPVSIKVVSHDRPGVLSLVSKNINNQGINIRSAVGRSLSDKKGHFIFEIEVKDYNELLRIISSIESLEEVISVTRT